jgi:hypothetical protein
MTTTNAATNAVAISPFITRQRLKADPVEALRLVPPCLALAAVVRLPPDFPFDGDSLTVVRPDGRHADQVTMRTIAYAAMCELKRFGGGFNLNRNADGSTYLRSTYSRRAPELGGNTPVQRILDNLQARQVVRGAAHVTGSTPGENVLSSDTIASGFAKRGARQSALDHAARYARLHAPEGYDIAAYLANLQDLFEYYDELMSAARTAA